MEIIRDDNYSLIVGGILATKLTAMMSAAVAAGTAFSAFTTLHGYLIARLGISSAILYWKWRQLSKLHKKSRDNKMGIMESVNKIRKSGDRQYTSQLDGESINDWLSRAKKDVRLLNSRPINHRNTALAKTGARLAGVTIGVAIGSAAGKQVVNLLARKYIARVTYLESLGMNITPEKRKELKELKTRLRILKASGMLVGAISMGALANYGVKYALEEKRKFDSKQLWDTRD